MAACKDVSEVSDWLRVVLGFVVDSCCMLLKLGFLSAGLHASLRAQVLMKGDAMTYMNDSFKTLGWLTKTRATALKNMPREPFSH